MENSDIKKTQNFDADFEPVEQVAKNSKNCKKQGITKKIKFYK
jgi:hypothetical protein